MRVLILGNGYVGSEMGAYFNVKPISRSEKDYTQQHRFERLLLDARPSVVINCAGVTGRPNIDWCEDNRIETIQGNVMLPVMLSKVCHFYRTPFMHISSGCVYQGGPFTEHDRPDFSKLSFYSLTKAIADDGVYGWIMRIRMPFGLNPHPRSFITKIRSYPKLINERNSMTFLPSLCIAAECLVTKQAPFGIYNVVNDGFASHKDVVDIFNGNGHQWHPEFIDAEEFSGMTKAVRSNCILDNEKVSRYCRLGHVHAKLNAAARRQLERKAA